MLRSYKGEEESTSLHKAKAEQTKLIVNDMYRIYTSYYIYIVFIVCKSNNLCYINWNISNKIIFDLSLPEEIFYYLCGLTKILHTRVSS